MPSPTYLCLALALLISSCFPNGILAQLLEGPKASALVAEAELIWRDEHNGSLKHLGLSDSLRPPESEALPWIRTALSLRPEDGLQAYDSHSDPLGFTHRRYHQLYQGIRVLHGRYYLHFKDGHLHSANGEWYPHIQLSITPSIETSVALEVAKTFETSRGNLALSIPSSAEELWVYADTEGIYHLVYRFDLFVGKAGEERAYLMVDAHSGQVVGKETRTHPIMVNGIAETQHRGPQIFQTDSVAPDSFRLRDQSRGNGIHTFSLNHFTFSWNATDITDEDNHWADSLPLDQAAADVHWGTQLTYDYFLQEFGRSSFDGSGQLMESYVNYGNQFSNAFWDGAGMFYGDGDSSSGVLPFTSLDIVAHEVVHGLTEHTAGLVYQNQSGALNEGFSDIFGMVIDFYQDSSQANWLMGDEINYPFRSAANPNQFFHPDTYVGDFWHVGLADNGGVHTNSGVLNHWFYLLVNGGSGINDHGKAYCVKGIGLKRAAAIAYRTLTVYLTPNADFVAAKYYARIAAYDLYGIRQEFFSTQNAWRAVAVGGWPNFTQHTVTAQFSSSSQFVCDTPASIQFLNHSINGVYHHW
ncbi:MAG: M4 family metallopeptidase, partial [Bacteroidota bacterium]